VGGGLRRPTAAWGSATSGLRCVAGCRRARATARRCWQRAAASTLGIPEEIRLRACGTANRVEEGGRGGGFCPRSPPQLPPHGGRKRGDRAAALPRRRRRPCGVGRAFHAPPRPPCPHGPDAPRPTRAGARRRLGRHPGDAHRGVRAAAGVPEGEEASLLPLAQAPRRTEGDPAPPAPPGRAAARPPPGGAAPRRAAAGGDVGRARAAAPRQLHGTERGGRARRAASASRGGAQLDGARRPGDPRAAPLRAADERRGGAGAGPRGGGRVEAVRPSVAPAEGRARGRRRGTSGIEPGDHRPAGTGRDPPGASEGGYPSRRLGVSKAGGSGGGQPP